MTVTLTTTSHDEGIPLDDSEKELAAGSTHGRATIPKRFHEKFGIKAPGELPRAANRRIDCARSA